MKDGSPFGIGGLWENWKNPTSGEWVRTFAIITTDANELVAEIHDRMPLILASGDYTRWPSEEPNPRDLMRPFPAEPMRMWPISIDCVDGFGGILRQCQDAAFEGLSRFFHERVQYFHRLANLLHNSFRSGSALAMLASTRSSTLRRDRSSARPQRPALRTSARSRESRVPTGPMTNGKRLQPLHLGKARRQLAMLSRIVERDRLIIVRSALGQVAGILQRRAHKTMPDHERDNRFLFLRQ